MRNLIIAIITMVFAGSAFADGEYGASNVDMNQARRIGKAQMGVVVEARPMDITVTSNKGKIAGAAVGAATGGIACRKQGYSVQMLCGTIAGLAGGAVGNSVSTEVRPGVEILVMLEGSQEIITVAQELRGTVVPAEGSRVFVATINGTTRVFPAGSNNGFVTQTNYRM